MIFYHPSNRTLVPLLEPKVMDQILSDGAGCQVIVMVSGSVTIDFVRVLYLPTDSRSKLWFSFNDHIKNLAMTLAISMSQIDK
jgi:hypothetical protein